jgi:hypothetical protein
MMIDDKGRKGGKDWLRSRSHIEYDEPLGMKRSDAALHQGVMHVLTATRREDVG